MWSLRKISDGKWLHKCENIIEYSCIETTKTKMFW